MNVGSSEFLIIALFALLLFGPTLLAFWLGYLMGQKRGAESAPGSDVQAAGEDAEATDTALTSESTSEERPGDE